MLFNSFSFIYFLLIVFAVYYLPVNMVRKNQVLILVLASCFFYSFHKPLLLLLLLVSILMNTCVSYGIRKKQGKIKPLLFLGIFFNLGILAFFKYGPLIAATIANEFNSRNGVLDFILTIPLPIGISFYTFEGISLLLDLYKGKIVFKEDNPSFLQYLQETAFFISFFPHLVAGPILKARDFYPQIGYKPFKNIQWENAIKKIILGFFLKMVIADNLNEITAIIEFPNFQWFSSGNLLLFLLGYSIQIFADFAGYSLIAIGLGALFGYTLPTNFNFPYLSASFAEFWHRWHISLSTWLRDYLYIPLGGNRKGKARTYFNIFIVMAVGGLWHGAAWSYAVWGAMHGFFLLLERALWKEKEKQGIQRVIGTIYVFIIVSILWTLFKLTDFNQFLLYFKAIGNNTHIHFRFAIEELSILLYTLLIVLYHWVYIAKANPAFREKFNKVEPVLYGVLVFLIIVNSGPQQAFIYFQF